jgi:glycosyltransferase involved in cell wall biosynthesis
MRIAILGSVALPIFPPLQGGTEWIAYYQAKGLSEKGHEVILFGAKGTAKNFQDSTVKVVEVGGEDLATGSKNEAKFDPILMESSRKLRLESIYLAEVSRKLIEFKDEYDIILNNMRGEAVFLPVAKLINKPFVNVMHLNLFNELASILEEFNTHVITISNAQRKNYKNLNYLATVYNGVDIDKFKFNVKPDDYLLMVGTIGRHKNQASAISVAKKMNKKLILAGKIRDKDYFEELKKDIDDEQIKWIGEMGFEEKLKLYMNAKVFLFPILWEEPFGLVMIEAMACGTPVIAFNHGAVSEVVVNGKTGFVVENEDQMADSLLRINFIGREDCRRRVQENFTIEKMIDNYEKALLKL